MAISTTTAAPILTPDQISELLVVPTIGAALVGEVATVVRTRSKTMRFPRVAVDPSASWVSEGETIVPSDAVFAEVESTPRKVAGLTIISSEAANDTTPEALEVIGDGLSRDLARKLDTAFFGALSLPAPPGLGSLTGADAPTEVAGPVEWDSLDAFAEAISEAEMLGVELTSWVTSPQDALALAILRTQSGSNMALLADTATGRARRVVQGLPLYVSADVPEGVCWGLPKTRVFLVVREDAQIESDASVYFDSDRIAVRAILRASFAFPHGASIVKITRAEA